MRASSSSPNASGLALPLSSSRLALRIRSPLFESHPICSFNHPRTSKQRVTRAAPLMSLPIIDLDVFRTDTDTVAVHAQAEKVSTRDPRTMPAAESEDAKADLSAAADSRSAHPIRRTHCQRFTCLRRCQRRFPRRLGRLLQSNSRGSRERYSPPIPLSSRRDIGAYREGQWNKFPASTHGLITVHAAKVFFFRVLPSRHCLPCPFRTSTGHRTRTCRSEMPVSVKPRPEALWPTFAAADGPLHCRFFHRMGTVPAKTAFPSLSMDNVVPEAFKDSWTESMESWGKQIKAAVEGVSEALAVGLGLERGTFTKAGEFGPHLLAPTSTDLVKYGKVGEGGLRAAPRLRPPADLIPPRTSLCFVPYRSQLLDYPWTLAISWSAHLGAEFRRTHQRVIASRSSPRASGQANRVSTPLKLYLSTPFAETEGQCADISPTGSFSPAITRWCARPRQLPLSIVAKPTLRQPTDRCIAYRRLSSGI